MHRRSALWRPRRERYARSNMPRATAATPNNRQTCCPRRAPGPLWRIHAATRRCGWLTVCADSEGAGKPARGHASSASEAASTSPS
eukprot:2063207-Alexandrium_andersonii.AAC.1